MHFLKQEFHYFLFYSANIFIKIYLYLQGIPYGAPWCWKIKSTFGYFYMGCPVKYMYCAYKIYNFVHSLYASSNFELRTKSCQQIHNLLQFYVFLIIKSTKKIYTKKNGIKTVQNRSFKLIS